MLSFFFKLLPSSSPKFWKSHLMAALYLWPHHSLPTNGDNVRNPSPGAAALTAGTLRLQKGRGDSPSISPQCWHFPATALYLVRFIEDTEGTFILRLGGELKVLNVLRYNLPVGDEVALGFHQQSRELDTELRHASRPRPRNSNHHNLSVNWKAPSFPIPRVPQTFTRRLGEWPGIRTDCLFTFLDSTHSLFTQKY